MKLQFSLAIALLTVLGSHQGILLAQSCLNCWINPQTGQQESLERIIPRQVPSDESPPVISEPLSPKVEEEAVTESNNEKNDGSSPDSDNPPVLVDPLEGLEAETEPQPLPRTQVEPRFRYEQQEQRINEQ